MTRERKAAKLQAMAERLMGIQARGCYRQLTPQERAEYDELYARYQRLSALFKAQYQS